MGSSRTAFSELGVGGVVAMRQARVLPSPCLLHGLHGLQHGQSQQLSFQSCTMHVGFLWERSWVYCSYSVVDNVPGKECMGATAGLEALYLASSKNGVCLGSWRVRPTTLRFTAPVPGRLCLCDGLKQRHQGSTGTGLWRIDGLWWYSWLRACSDVVLVFLVRVWCCSCYWCCCSCRPRLGYKLQHGAVSCHSFPLLLFPGQSSSTFSHRAHQRASCIWSTGVSKRHGNHGS